MIEIDNYYNSQAEKEQFDALKDFLMDIECLNPLAEWTSKFNLFDILKISRTEIRHSNVLAWLLDPNENHGFDDDIIRGFIQYVVKSFVDDKDVFSTLLMDCHGFVLQREWHNVDILAISTDEKFLICIENKIDSGEHDNQLNRYRKQVEGAFPDFRKMYIYLSPDGTEPSDPENWCSMSYLDVLDIIENSRRKVQLLPDAALLIDNYVETIRRDIVGDDRLTQICAEIYAKHKKALDLIFENKPDRVSELGDIIRSWCMEMTEAGEMELVLDKCNKTYIRFKTKTMSEILPDAAEEKSGWGTKNHYFYEIRILNKGSEFLIQLAFSSKDIPDDLRAICDKINEYYPSRIQKDNWQWRTPFSTKSVKVGEELSADKIYEQLSRKFTEVKSFEEKLKGLILSPAGSMES